MLAVYYAFIDTVYKFSSTAKFPIVVDSPKQQEQDSMNADVIASFCAKNRPDSAQLVLATLNYNSTDTSITVYELNEKKGLLLNSEYQEHSESLLYLEGLLAKYAEKNLTISSSVIK